MNAAPDRSDDNRAAELDAAVAALADYAWAPPQPSDDAVRTARMCVLDSIGCAFAALDHPACTAHLGPVVPGAALADGARVIGTGEQLDPVKAAFDNGALIRWLDFNDTWLAAEWGHPSDNLGGLLALADYRCRNPGVLGKPVALAQLFDLAIQAHEIQGVLALENSFNRVGIDHVLLVKVATAGLAAKLAGGDRAAVASAISNAWTDGGTLRAYRHAPNASQRKSWAAGDATSRGVRLGLMAARCGMPALNSGLSAARWGFADVCFGGTVPKLAQPLGCYVMENILFKVSFPAEFHAQTAVECAVRLHKEFAARRSEVRAVRITTQESAVRIIAKTGELRNYADRDHCLQYMVAVGLIEGALRAEHYDDSYARLSEVDELRALMTVAEDERYTRDYLDAAKRSIANAVQLEYADGSMSERIAVEYPLGHRRRRAEADGPLRAKFMAAAQARIGDERAQRALEMVLERDPAEVQVSALLDLCAPD